MTVKAPTIPTQASSPDDTDPATAQGAVGEGSGEIVEDGSDDDLSFVENAFEATSEVDDPDALEDVEEEVKPVAATPAQPEEPQAPAAPAQQPVQPQAPQQAQEPPQQVVQPVAPQAPQQVQQPVVQGQPRQPDQNALDTLQRDITARRDDYIKQTASSLEATFTDQDIDEFHENPKVALSKMGARLHHDIVSNVLAMISAKVPEMLGGMLIQHESARRSEDKFFADYPALAPHREVVASLAPMIAQMNPGLTGPEFGKKLALAAQLQLGNAYQPPAAPKPAPKGRRMPAYNPAGGRQQPGQSQQQPIEDDWGRVDFLMDATDNDRIPGLR